MPQRLGRDRRARRQARAQEFGRRHPRLTVGIVCVLLAGAVAVCAFQLGHGTYLGRTWLIAAAAGIATAIVLGAAAAISNRRHGPALGRLEWAWTILAVLSASSLRLPFPVGPYDGVQAFFNVVHATLLGYAVVSYTALTALLAYVLIRPLGLPGRLELRRPAPRSADALRRRPGGSLSLVSLSAGS
jgi:drug/metabolite transporter (DMT)-like permease